MRILMLLTGIFRVILAVSGVQTQFLLALDFLTLVAVLLLSFGSSGVTHSGLGTIALLAFLQFAVMAFALLAWASLDQILHAAVVLVALVASAVVAKLKQREFEAELAAFVSKY